MGSDQERAGKVSRDTGGPSYQGRLYEYGLKYVHVIARKQREQGRYVLPLKKGLFEGGVEWICRTRVVL